VWCLDVAIQRTLNISRVLCGHRENDKVFVLLIAIKIVGSRMTTKVSGLYIDNIMHTSWSAMLIISLYTVQNTINTSLLLYNSALHGFSIYILMITCRTLILLCIGSNLYIQKCTAKYIQEIKFQKLFFLFLCVAYSFFPRTLSQWKLLPEAAVQCTTLDSFREQIPISVLEQHLHI
jgi:hypothetical protein